MSFRMYLEPRDAWVGAYVAKDAVYVCPLPFVVFRWRWAEPAPVSAPPKRDPASTTTCGTTIRNTANQPTGFGFGTVAAHQGGKP